MNFPALLTSQPETSHDAQNLQHYEVLPTEPLHDFKGHMSNIIEELKVLLDGEVKAQFYRVVEATIKDTRSSKICSLIDTIVEVCELMYAREESQSPKTTFAQPKFKACTLVPRAVCYT